MSNKDSIDSIVTEDVKPTVAPKKRRGRPPKSLVEQNKRGNRGKVGRPKGDASAIEALDDDHKNQSAAWKLIVDRIMPLSYFEKDKLSNGRAAVSITINGIDSDSPITIGETIDGDVDDDV